MRYTFVRDGLRLKGGLCGIYTHDGDVQCKECKNTIRAGTKFTVGELKSDRPVCAHCQPYNEQMSLLDHLADPSRSRIRPTHKTTEEVHTQGGDHLERGKCYACGGKGHKGAPLKVRCQKCTGTGYIWTKIAHDLG